MTRIILIVLFTDRQQIIATNRQQPFFIKEDLKRFRSITLGHTVVMGRKTYEAIGKPLAKRKNIILTTSLPRQEGLVIARSMEDLKVILQSESKVYIIGGGQIYQQFFSTATAIEVTRVYAPIEGENSISFPIISPGDWVQSSTSDLKKSLATTHTGKRFEVSYRFETYYRNIHNT